MRTQWKYYLRFLHLWIFLKRQRDLLFVLFNWGRSAKSHCSRKGRIKEASVRTRCWTPERNNRMPPAGPGLGGWCYTKRLLCANRMNWVRAAGQFLFLSHCLLSHVALDAVPTVRWSWLAAHWAHMSCKKGQIGDMQETIKCKNDNKTESGQWHIKHV